MKTAMLSCLSFVLLLTPFAIAEPPRIELRIERTVAAEGDDTWDWWQARTAYVSSTPPLWVTTMSQTGKTGTHDFHDIYMVTSRDGVEWTKPAVIPSLRRVETPDGFEVAPGDLWPNYHAASGKVLVTGKSFNYAGGTKEDRLRERVTYAVLDPTTGVWGPMRYLEMPKTDHAGYPIIAANAGCNQRVDLADGDVLLAVRYVREPDNKKTVYTSIVARCDFDGETLTYKEHGTEHTVPTPRGLYEPSLARLGDRYFFTLRNDETAYVTRGDDGIHFKEAREWTFDDGAPLGSYNTQQHWVTVAGGLFLVYTRRGADNDHIMRHRAPLFIAQVDPDRLCVLRATEQILLPENHATLGNSGVCQIDENEAWVTCGEGRIAFGERKAEHNRVLVAKIVGHAGDGR